MKSGKTFHGIKGPTSLADIEGFDFIGAFYRLIDLFKSQTVPLPTSKLIHRMICLPSLYEIQNYKRLNIEGNISLSLLGKKITRNLSIDEQSFVKIALLHEENNIGSREISKMIEMIENTACAVNPEFVFEVEAARPSLHPPMCRQRSA